MKTNYNIKNFRVFDENGVDLTIEPITILTGCNSSGKSSIVKSLCLLNTFLKEISDAVKNGGKLDFYKYKLDFSSYPNNTLGRFDRVVNRKSEEKRIVFEYTIYSLILAEDIKVNLSFSSDPNNLLNNGYLDSFSITSEAGVIISSQKGKGKIYNINIVKDQLLGFIQQEYKAHHYCGLYSRYDFDRDTISKEDFESQKGTDMDFFKKVGQKRMFEVCKFIRTNGGRPIVEQVKMKPKILDCSFENVQVFNIPVLEVLNDSTKESISDDINKLGAINSNLNIGVQKVVKDFSSSEYSTFGEYFEAKTDEYLGDIEKSFSFLDNLYQGKTLDIWNFELRRFYFDFEDIPLYEIDSNKVKELSDKDKLKTREEDIREFEDAPMTFSLIYEVVMLLNYFYSKESEYYKYEEDKEIGDLFAYHYIYRALALAVQRLEQEVLIPDWSQNFAYISTSRIEVKRFYSLDSNDYFTNLLKRYAESKQNLLNPLESLGKNEYVPDSFMNKWLNRFGIAKVFDISMDTEGLGVQIRIKDTNSDQGVLLADEGYGISQLFSILLEIETYIMSAKQPINHNYWGLNDIDGYGSHFHFPEQTIAIEEPEIHLHPKFQSLLAEMFNEAYKKYNIHFIIETHSEYLIRKEQVLVADKESELHVDNDKISIIYVNEEDTENEPKAKNIRIRKNGSLTDNFGEGFFDEAHSLIRQIY